MDKLNLKKKRFQRRRLKIKKSLLTCKDDRKRLCISKSNKSMYVQIIDDSKGHTLVALSTLSKDFAEYKNKCNVKAAGALGKLFAEKAKAAGITRIKFDRNGFLFHGRIKAFADAVRKNGIEF